MPTKLTSTLFDSRLRIFLGLAAASVILVLVGYSVSQRSQEFAEDSRWLNRTHENLALIQSLYAAIKDAESAQRGFLLTGTAELEGEFFAAIPRVHGFVARLEQALADNPEQSERMRALKAATEVRLDHAMDILRRFREHGFESAREEVGKAEGKRLMEEIAAISQTMQDEERELLVARSESSEISLQRLQSQTIIGIMISGGLLLLVFAFIIRENMQRRRAERTAGHVNEQLEETVTQLRRAGADTRELSQYAGMLQSCRSVDEALSVTADTFTRLLPAFGGNVFLLRPSRDLAEMVRAWGEQALPSEMPVPTADCWALRRGQPHSVDDRDGDTHCAHAKRDPARPAIAVCVPITAHGETMGFVYLSRAVTDADRDIPPEQRPPSRREIAAALVEQLALALANLKLQDTLRTQSIRDPLTGLFNRRYLEESLQRELARCERRELPLSLLMLDVDHFKRFNDQHGHDGGDAVLVRFAQTLTAHSRHEDIACRYGGEEFTLILPEMSIEDAARRAEAIRRLVSEMTVQHNGKPLPAVTVSIGVSTFPADGSDPPTLLRAADAALYRAKQQGRNRVITAATG
ncbi:MAG: diguanylate cyclase [Lysobacteraceae bacterium]